MLYRSVDECFAAYRKASIALTCWSLFLAGVAALVVWWAVQS